MPEDGPGKASELPDFLRIPDGYRRSSDPVESNPFAMDDPRHRVWDEATLRAEEEVSRLNSKLISRSQRQTWNGESALEILINHVCENALPKFDIWAKRNIQVVWGTQDAEGYALWLVNYAEAWLKSYRESYERDPLPDIVDSVDALRQLRLHLIERIEFWKAEARRYLAEQRAHVSTVVEESGKLSAGKQRHYSYRNRSRSQEYRDGVVFGAIQAKLQGRHYCKYLDAKKIQPNSEWQSSGCPNTFAAAYNNKRWRKRIQDQKHKSKLRYEALPKTEIERLIQAVTARPTRS